MFKESLPASADLDKTFVVFTNNAVGELFIGISNELKEYPEIEFNWFEKGLQFQIQFIKKDIGSQGCSPAYSPSYYKKYKPLEKRLKLSWDSTN